VDGDATYQAEAAWEGLEHCETNRLDILNIARAKRVDEAFRPGHEFGNWLFNQIVIRLFGNGFVDMLSGYKIFSRKFVKSFPALSPGFEIETELTVFGLVQGMKMQEIFAPYYERPEGSFSKLSTFKDGFKVLKMIIKLLKYEKPLLLFGSIGLMLAIISIFLGVPIIITYMQIHAVPRVPTAILSTGIMIIAVLSCFCGLILDNLTRTKRELQRVAYLRS